MEKVLNFVSAVSIIFILEHLDANPSRAVISYIHCRAEGKMLYCRI